MLLVWGPLRTTILKISPTLIFKISLTYQALEKNWTEPWQTTWDWILYSRWRTSRPRAIGGLRNHVWPCQGIMGELIKCLTKHSRLIFKWIILYRPRMMIQMAVGRIKVPHPCSTAFLLNLPSFHGLLDQQLFCVYFYKLEDNECISSMEQWDQYKLLVFVFRNIDSVDDHLYPVGPLTCAEVILRLSMWCLCFFCPYSFNEMFPCRLHYNLGSWLPDVFE